MWANPLDLDLIPTTDSFSFNSFEAHQTGVPLSPHPGAFGVVRKNHIHEGVDLYAAKGSSVYSVEEGEVVAVLPFTGEHAGSSWWENTYAVLVLGESGVVLYGEILAEVKKGDRLKKGQKLGVITPVLKKDKGRPISMLHLELHTKDSRSFTEWALNSGCPSFMRDPTPYLLELANL